MSTHLWCLSRSWKRRWRWPGRPPTQSTRPQHAQPTVSMSITALNILPRVWVASMALCPTVRRGRDAARAHPGLRSGRAPHGNPDPSYVSGNPLTCRSQWALGLGGRFLVSKPFSPRLEPSPPTPCPPPLCWSPQNNESEGREQTPPGLRHCGRPGRASRCCGRQ